MLGALWASAFASVTGCKSTGPANAAKTERLPWGRTRELVLRLEGVEKGANGFPVMRASLANKSDRRLRVIEHPNHVWAHAGPYTAGGPLGTFAGKRRTLEPGQSLSLAVPTGGWFSKSEVGGTFVEKFEPGSYEVWVSYKVNGERITSGRMPFVVK